VKFSQALADDSPFAPREFIAGKDARTLARDLLAQDDEGFRAVFRKSPMKRAKLSGLKRNAAVVLGNVGKTDDVDALTLRSTTWRHSRASTRHGPSSNVAGATTGAQRDLRQHFLTGQARGIRHHLGPSSIRVHPQSDAVRRHLTDPSTPRHARCRHGVRAMRSCDAVKSTASTASDANRRHLARVVARWA